MKFKNQFTAEKIIQVYNKTESIRATAKELGQPRETVRDWINVLCKAGLLVKKTQTKKDGKAEKKIKIPLNQISPPSVLILPKRKKARYVVTCAQNNTDVHRKFMDSLYKYCDHNNAQLIVIPIRYKNVNAYCPVEHYEPHWRQELYPYFLNSNKEINKNLVIMGDFKIQATAINPISHVGPVAGHRSAIFGHGQIQMKMIPTPMHELPRQLLTTGSCTVKNYSTSSTGSKAAFHHTLGATIVEVDGDLFFTRQLIASEDGDFYDLDKHYTPDSVTDGHRAAGLVCGDIHAIFIDPNVKKATWTNKNSIVNIFKPENQYFHDVIDSYSISHHHRNNVFVKYAKHHSGFDNLRNEIQNLINLHNEVWNREDTNYFYISSNHNDHVLRWLSEVDIRHDPENALLYHQLMVYMLSHTKMDYYGASYPNPLEFMIKPKIINPNNTYFPSRNEEVSLLGIDLSQHGDRGPNGAKGSAKAFASSGYRTVIGHRHSPCIEKGCWQTGTNSILNPEYISGYSSWLQTDCIIYPNGKRTLINIIGDRFMLED